MANDKIQFRNSKIQFCDEKIAFEEEHCCVYHPCPWCTNSRGPDSFQVVLSGIVNGSCSSCGSLNGTFVADAYIVDCKWLYALPSSICSFIQVQVIVRQKQVAVHWYEPMNQITWKKNYGSAPSCTTLMNEDIPWFSGSGPVCDASASTCKLTAL